ncbi:MAG TPA: hypothetical protein VF438_01225 [Candidatus Paceibacterota bacterium]
MFAIVAGLLLVVLLILVRRLRSQSLVRSEPTVINFDDRFARMPFRGCGIDPSKQIACRVFQKMEIRDDTVSFYEITPDDAILPRLPYIKDFFNRQSMRENAMHPFPPHIIDAYIDGKLKVPAKYARMNVVCVGIIWTPLTPTGKVAGEFVQGFGPDDETGVLVPMNFDVTTEFQKGKYVFAVFRPKIAVPHGIRNVKSAEVVA